MTTSIKTESAVIVPASARELAVKGLREAVQAELYKGKASKAQKGATVILTEAAIECGSGAALKALWEGLMVEIRQNIGGLAVALKAQKGAKGEYKVPKGASVAMSELLAAYELGVSLFETDEKTGEVTDKPKAFNAVRNDVRAERSRREAEAVKASNPALFAALREADELAELVGTYRQNIGWILANNDHEAVGNLAGIIISFRQAVNRVQELRIEADRKAEAEAKAGDEMAEAEAEAEKPEPKAKAKAASK